MNLQECFEKGLLRKRRPDILKSKRAMELAVDDLDRARMLIEKEFYMESTLLSYTGMFQAARALLFNDGVFERSHWCLVEYLKERYVKNHILAINHVNWLDVMRTERHAALYGLERAATTRGEAEESHRRASVFISEVERILKTASK